MHTQSDHDHNGHHHDADAFSTRTDEKALDPAKPFTDPVCGMKVSANPDKKIVHAGSRPVSIHIHGARRPCRRVLRSGCSHHYLDPAGPDPGAAGTFPNIKSHQIADGFGSQDGTAHPG